MSLAAAMRAMQNEVPYLERVQIRERLLELWHHHLTNEQKAGISQAYLAECARSAIGVLVSVDAVLTMTVEELLQWHPSALSFAKR